MIAVMWCNEPGRPEVVQFLAAESVRTAGASAGAARRAAVRTIPDGNHGDNQR